MNLFWEKKYHFCLILISLNIALMRTNLKYVVVLILLSQPRLRHDLTQTQLSFDTELNSIFQKLTQIQV